MDYNTNNFIFYDIRIDNISKENLLNKIKNNNLQGGQHIAFVDTFTVSFAQKNKELKHILNSAWYTLADGKPIEFLAKRKGLKDLSTISGYWLLRSLLKSDLSHYFYGTYESELNKMITKIMTEYPKAKIKGWKSPPILSTEDIFENKLIKTDMDEISKLNPDLLWIGLSSPKQDLLIYKYKNVFSDTILLGIGGVFDYFSGRIEKSPEWVKRVGLRWLYRLIKEPKRLWKKYFVVFKVLGIKYFFDFIKG